MYHTYMTRRSNQKWLR